MHTITQYWQMHFEIIFSSTPEEESISDFYLTHSVNLPAWKTIDLNIVEDLGGVAGLRRRLKPSCRAYLLPSFLSVCISDPAFHEFVLEYLMPFDKRREARADLVNFIKYFSILKR